MLSLNTRLSTIGISSAKGVDLVMQRDQLKGTLPEGESAGTSSAQTSSTEQDTKQTTVRQALTPEQQRQVRELQQIDRTVRAHEQAHLSAGHGVVTSGASFSYTYGPDGRQYATAGEVGIDTSPEDKPEANIDKGLRIQAAALAPRDPSPQDYQVAAVGSRLEGQGRSDLVRQQQEERITAEETASAQRVAESGEAAAAPVVEEEAAAPPDAGDNQRVSSAYLATSAENGARINTFA